MTPIILKAEGSRDDYNLAMLKKMEEELPPPPFGYHYETPDDDIIFCTGDVCTIETKFVLVKDTGQ